MAAGGGNQGYGVGTYGCEDGAYYGYTKTHYVVACPSRETRRGMLTMIGALEDSGIVGTLFTDNDVCFVLDIPRREIVFNPNWVGKIYMNGQQVTQAMVAEEARRVLESIDPDPGTSRSALGEFVDTLKMRRLDSKREKGQEAARTEPQPVKAVAKQPSAFALRYRKREEQRKQWAKEAEKMKRSAARTGEATAATTDIVTRLIKKRKDAVARYSSCF
jgi:hypothetical protein